MKKFLGFGLVALLAYLLAWPVPVEPQTWEAPEPAAYVGEFAVNDRLERFDSLGIVGLHGPEAAVTDALGNLYATTHEGWIVRWLPGSIEAEKWLELGGRPLGLAFDELGNLWVANAYFGLQKIARDKQVTDVVSSVDGTPVLYADDVAVSESGMVYFSDASMRFSAEKWGGTLPASLLDINEHGRTGRVIEYNPKTNTSKVIFEGLSFANGVALDPAGEFLLVVETAEYRVWKLWLSGSRTGTREVIASDLPGFPDNIHVGQNCRYWVGLTAPRSAMLDKLADKPFMRKVVQRLPAFMRPKVLPYGMVVAMDDNGNILHNLQSPSGAVYATTGVSETDDYLYVTSLTAPFLARLRKADLGIN